jgi:hypothetical protein
MVFLIIVIMEKNIKLIIKKIHKTNKIYFYKEEYNDFIKEFEYRNPNIIFIDFSYIYNLILHLLKKYKILIIIIIIIFIYIKYY